MSLDPVAVLVRIPLSEMAYPKLGMLPKSKLGKHEVALMVLFA